MSAYENRLLDLDIREVLGAESPPDVWPAIASQLHGRRPRLRYLRGRGGADAHRWPAVQTWAAAALLVAGVGLLWWAYGPAAPDRETAEQPTTPRTMPAPPDPVPASPFARMDRAVRIASTDGARRQGREAKPGDRIVVDEDGVTVRLRDGTILGVEGAAWLALDETAQGASLALGRGRILVEAGDGLVLLRGGPGEMRVRPATTATIGRLGQEEAWDADAWLRGAEPAAGDVVVRVERGRVEASDLSAGGGQRIAWFRELPPRVGVTLDPETRAYLDDRLAMLDRFAALDLRTPASFEADKEATQGVRDLQTRLREDADAWAYALPWLERRLRGKDASRASRMALRLLVQDPELRALESIHTKLRELGSEANPRELLPLAEGTDDAVAVAAIRRIVRERTDPFDVQLAAYLALRGDDGGRPVLDAVLRQPDALRRNPSGAAAAAAGLHRLGYRTAWSDLREDLGVLVEEAIDRGELWRAQAAVAAASYFASAIRTPEPVSVYDLGRRIQAHGRGLSLVTAAGLREELLRIP